MEGKSAREWNEAFGLALVVVIVTLHCIVTLQVYNVYMTLLSLWMGVVMYGELWRTDTFAWNRHRDISPEGGALLAFAIWVNFISKPTEYVDTLFFLLRGNMRQVSFLHVSHHAIMPIMMASAVLRYPGGNSAFGPGLNCECLASIIARLCPRSRSYCLPSCHSTALRSQARGSRAKRRYFDDDL